MPNATHGCLFAANFPTSAPNTLHGASFGRRGPDRKAQGNTLKNGRNA
jgi:hypothetical protein